MKSVKGTPLKYLALLLVTGSHLLLASCDNNEPQNNYPQGGTPGQVKKKSGNNNGNQNKGSSGQNKKNKQNNINKTNYW